MESSTGTLAKFSPMFLSQHAKSSPWLQRFIALTAVATLGLIAMGGLVTSHGAGMSVPDWPTSYGYNMFYFPISKWIGGIFYEHSHRLWASLVGLFTAVLAIWIWVREARGWPRRVAVGSILATLALMGVRTPVMFVVMALLAFGIIVFNLIRVLQGDGTLRRWATIAFAAVVIQGVLGGLRVTQMKDEIGILHAALAQLFFSLLCVLALTTTRFWREADSGKLSIYAGQRLRYCYGLAAGMIFGQLLLGATMRHQHAGLAIPDFPKAYGKWWPDTDAAALARYNGARGEVVATNPITASGVRLQMAHRIWAVMVLLAVASVFGMTRRIVGARHPLAWLSGAWFSLVVAQAALGAATIWTQKSADVATAHVVFGALSLALGIVLFTLATRSANQRRLMVTPNWVQPRSSEPAVATR